MEKSGKNSHNSKFKFSNSEIFSLNFKFTSYNSVFFPHEIQIKKVIKTFYLTIFTFFLQLQAYISQFVQIYISLLQVYISHIILRQKWASIEKCEEFICKNRSLKFSKIIFSLCFIVSYLYFYLFSLKLNEKPWFLKIVKKKLSSVFISFNHLLTYHSSFSFLFLHHLMWAIE